MYDLSLMLQVWYTVWTCFLFDICVLCVYIIQYTVQLGQARGGRGWVNTYKQVLTGRVLLTPHAQLLLLMSPSAFNATRLLSGQKVWCFLPPTNYV